MLSVAELDFPFPFSYYLSYELPSGGGWREELLRDALHQTLDSAIGMANVRPHLATELKLTVSHQL